MILFLQYHLEESRQAPLHAIVYANKQECKTQLEGSAGTLELATPQNTLKSCFLGCALRRRMLPPMAVPLDSLRAPLF